MQSLWCRYKEVVPGSRRKTRSTFEASLYTLTHCWGNEDEGGGGGLTEGEAMAVGTKNNYGSPKAVAMDFSGDFVRKDSTVDAAAAAAEAEFEEAAAAAADMAASEDATADYLAHVKSVAAEAEAEADAQMEAATADLSIAGGIVGTGVGSLSRSVLRADR